MPDSRRLLTLFLLVVVASLAAPAAQAMAGEIGGTAYKDLNRDGIAQPDEPRLADQRLYLYAGDGTYLGNALTDIFGRYAFAGLADGDYRVQYASPSWWSLREDWVPTTTGSPYPRQVVQLAGSATADFGWRPILRSTEIGQPLSSHAGPNGLRVESYDDVVDAKEIYDAAMLGLVGAEAPSVTIRFDVGTGSSTTTSATQSDGRYTSFRAVSYVTYVSWLDGGDQTLSHEYGHAWSLYHAYITQQDPTLAGYLEARGLTGDPRVGSGYAWSSRELIAEDYRQLLGSPNAQSGAQTNRDIPPAREVAGLEAYLRDTFTTPSSSGTPPPAGEQPPAPLAISDTAMSPNPVKSSGAGSFSLSAEATVTVTVRDAKGAVVRTLLPGTAKPAGAVSVSWDRTDSSGRRVKRGTYTLDVEARAGDGSPVTSAATFSVS